MAEHTESAADPALEFPDGYDPNEALRLANQLCFPLYAASKELVRRYKPYLDAIGLTYTQYLVMMALWEEDELNVRELGARVFLDSGTLTPLLKKLEQAGLVQRARSVADERQLIVSLTPAGAELKAEAARVPLAIGPCTGLEPAEAAELKRLLEKVRTSVEASWE